MKIQNIAITLILLQSISLFAQKDKNLPTDQVNVVKSFETRLADFEKLSTKPTLPPLDTVNTKQNMKYSIQEKTINIDYDAPKLRPISMKADPLPPAYDGYLKAGYGSLSSPYFDAGYIFNSDKTLEIGGKVHYESAKSTKITNQKYSKFGINLDGTYLMENNIGLSAKLGYAGNGYSFYGYDHEKYNFTSDSIKQQFNAFDIGAKIFSVKKTDSDFSFNGGLDLGIYNDRFDSKETALGFNATGTKWFADKHPLNITVKTQRVGFSDTTDQTISNIWLQPNFEFHHDMFNIHVGVNMLSTASKFKVFPDFKAALNLADNVFTVFAGWQGDAQINSFRTLSTYCPYVLSSMKINNAFYNEFYGGIKGSVNILDYQAQAGFKKVENQALFVSDTNPLRFNRLRVIYDTVSITYVKGNLVLRPIANLEISGSLIFNVFSPKHESAAWHLPALDGNFGAKYGLLDGQVKLKGNAYFQSGPNALTKTGATERLGSLFDLSVGAEYWPLKNVGIYVDANNLLNNKRQRWLGYDQFGININGGIVARF